MKSIIQKGIIPARTQSHDKKFQANRPCEKRRSGQVTTFVVCAVLSLSFQAVVLLTKTVKAWRNWPTLLAKHHCSRPNSNVR